MVCVPFVINGIIRAFMVPNPCQSSLRLSRIYSLSSASTYSLVRTTVVKLSLLNACVRSLTVMCIACASHYSLDIERFLRSRRTFLEIHIRLASLICNSIAYSMYNQPTKHPVYAIILTDSFCRTFIACINCLDHNIERSLFSLWTYASTVLQNILLKSFYQINSIHSAICYGCILHTHCYRIKFFESF
jgi:hypothetical protein